MISPKLLSVTVAVFLTSLPAFADNGNMMSKNMDGMAAQNKPMNHPKKPKQAKAKSDQMGGQNAMSGMSQMNGDGMAKKDDGMKSAKPGAH